MYLDGFFATKTSAQIHVYCALVFFNANFSINILLFGFKFITLQQIRKATEQKQQKRIPMANLYGRIVSVNRSLEYG